MIKANIEVNFFQGIFDILIRKTVYIPAKNVLQPEGLNLKKIYLQEAL